MQSFETGLLVHPVAYWLAASPDRLIATGLGEDIVWSLLEIKTVAPDISKEKFWKTSYIDRNRQFKRTSNHYYQMQMGMFLSGLVSNSLFLFVYLRPGGTFHLEEIPLHLPTCEEILVNCTKFYFAYHLSSNDP